MKRHDVYRQINIELLIDFLNELEPMISKDRMNEFNKLRYELMKGIE